MRRVMSVLILIGFAFIFAQDIPNNSKEAKRALSYQSLIKDSLGNPIADGKYLITFRLYDAVNSNDPVWFENLNVYITDGILNVLLGEKQRLRPELFINPLWVTLEMNGEESEKQYVSASSYSMYSGLVDLNAFAPSDDLSFSLAPDGRIIIELINPDPVPITNPNPVLNTIKFGLKVPDPVNTTTDSYQYLTMNNRNGVAVGELSHNLTSNKYKAGDDFEDFVITAKDGRDLVLMSESGTYGTSREVTIGTSNSPNDLKVTGNLSVTGKLSTSLFDERNFYTGGTNNWVIHTPDDLDANGVPRQIMCIINSSHLKPNVTVSDWSTQTIFYENGDFQPHSVIKSANDIKLLPKWNTSGGTVYIGTEGMVNDLRVNGKIFATEIEVNTNIFPDYVFKKDYNLLSLSEVENHINNYGTLPGMPSEKDVVENGLNISEMQLKLVEKIEELTLHMIRLEKENKELKEKINDLVK